MWTRRTFLRIGVGIGALLTCAPVFGMLGSIIGIAQAFNTLRSSGIGDPSRLSGAIGEMLLASAGGFALFPVGLVLLIVCGVLLSKMRRTGPPPLPRFPENFVGPSDKG